MKALVRVAIQGVASRYVTADHGLESIRIVAPSGSDFAQIAHLSWARPTNQGDASMYIRPFIGDGWSAKGAVAASVAADSSGEINADRVHPSAAFGDAKLSLHHSGQTHVYVGQSTGPGARANRLPEVRGERLDLDAGGHVATTVCFDVAGLPLLGRSPLSAPPDVRVVVAQLRGGEVIAGWSTAYPRSGRGGPGSAADDDGLADHLLTAFGIPRGRVPQRRRVP